MAKGLNLWDTATVYGMGASEDAGILDWCAQNDVDFFAYMTLEQVARTTGVNTRGGWERPMA